LPVRIYALAKQLKLDSRAMGDICREAGVTGKGSALASLTDEEEVQVREYLAGGRKAGASPSSAVSQTSATARARMPVARSGLGGAGIAAQEVAPTEFRREDYIAPGGSAGGKVPAMISKAPGPREKPRPAEEPATAGPPEEPATAIPPEEPATAVPLDEPATAIPPEELSPDLPPEELSPAIVPDDLAPVRPPGDLSSAMRPQELSSARKPKRPGPAKPPGKSSPTINLAPVPMALQPTEKPKPSEPAPQKPDIRLPADVMRAAGKAGTKPLAEHLRKHEERRKTTKPKAKSKPGVAESKPATPAVGKTIGRGRRGGAGTEKKGAEGATLGGREQRQLKRKRATTGTRRPRGQNGGSMRRDRRIRRTGANTAAPRKRDVVLQMPCTVRDFSEAVGVPAAQVIGKLMGLGSMCTITAQLDPELAELVAVELGVEVEIRRKVKLEDRLLTAVEQEEDDPALLQERPPIITFLGHVDHGKTSLLDRLIQTDVVSTESGGITQHIRAYRIEKNGKPLAFVDTPGHEAFTEMRARGANVTDIAVLVVAADDGVMPQTEEAISHARAAGVPIVVALNKMDLPGVDPQRTLQDLAKNELLPVEWGGDVEVVKTSATTGEGIDDLLETLLLVAEVHELKANPDAPARGTCLESRLHEGLGVVSKLLVRTGTLRIGDVVVCGSGYGRVKAMYDTLRPRKRHKEAGPSTPVDVTGLNVAPEAGQAFYKLDDVVQARQIAEQREMEARQQSLLGPVQHVTLENLHEHLGPKEEVQMLNLILRADVRGSIEAIRKELTKLEHPEVQLKILQATVGGVTEADVHLADASDAVIIGFNVVPDEGARRLAEERGVQVRRYEVIYKITEDLKAALEGMLKPEKREKELGRALVQRLFSISRLGVIAGCRVLAGTIERGSRVRIIRESRIIGEYPLDSLRRIKDDVKEVREGFECGMKLIGYNDLKEGDLLEAYKIEEVARSI